MFQRSRRPSRCQDPLFFRCKARLRSSPYKAEAPILRKRMRRTKMYKLVQGGPPPFAIQRIRTPQMDMARGTATTLSVQDLTQGEPKGPKGAAGPMGARGPKGPWGSQGIRGCIERKGPSGVTRAHEGVHGCFHGALHVAQTRKRKLGYRHA